MIWANTIPTIPAIAPLEIIFRNQAQDIKKIDALTEDYKKKFANPFVAASRGFIDDIILPKDTRKKIIGAVNMLKNKKLNNPWKKHDNIPL